MRQHCRGFDYSQSKPVCTVTATSDLKMYHNFTIHEPKEVNQNQENQGKYGSEKKLKKKTVIDGEGGRLHHSEMEKIES